MMHGQKNITFEISMKFV